MSATFLPIKEIVPNSQQPRRVFVKESLVEMAQTIKEHGGVIQPIIVEKLDTGYMLVDGERRLRASKLAGLHEIEAVVRERSNHNGRELLLSAIIANVQREDMNPIDEALAYHELNTVHNMTAPKISQKVGKNTKRIYDMLKLMKLEKPVQDLIRDGKLSHDTRLVDALLKMESSEMRVQLAKRAASQGLKIKTVVAAAQSLQQAVRAPGAGIRKHQTPALVLGNRKDDEEHEPPTWNALAQVGKLPAWSLVVRSAKQTCAKCELRDMANISTCGRCPAVVMIETLMQDADEVKS